MAPLRIGSLCYDYQTIDVVGPLDVISSGSKMIGEALTEYGPISDEVLSKAPEPEFHHIGLDLNPVTQLTVGYSMVPTVTVDSAPEIDILILGGPDPTGFKLHPKYAEYIRAHVAAGKLLFTNCTGSFVAAMSGVLDGKRATVNNVEYEWVKKQFPKVNWTRDTKWVVDGNVWTAGGAVTGMDMVAHWLDENYGRDVLLLSTMGLDFEPRDVNGVLNVLPQRFDKSGKQISTHVFSYHKSY